MDYGRHLDELLDGPAETSAKITLARRCRLDIERLGCPESLAKLYGSFTACEQALEGIARARRAQMGLHVWSRPRRNAFDAPRPTRRLA
jgi:hypothetical protein